MVEGSDDLEHFTSKIDLFTIAKWVGHRGIKMIDDVYGHLRTDYRLEQMSKVRIVGTNLNGVAKP